MVVSMSASVCALETNPASNAEGARNTPRASAARCQRANRLASAALASAKFLTGPGAKYIPHIEPACPVVTGTPCRRAARSEEHTSELQSRLHLVCRLLLEKKKNEHHRPAPYLTCDARQLRR